MAGKRTREAVYYEKLNRRINFHFSSIKKKRGKYRIIAIRLNEEGILRPMGTPWNQNSLNVYISLKLPHLKEEPEEEKIDKEIKDKIKTIKQNGSSVSAFYGDIYKMVDVIMEEKMEEIIEAVKKEIKNG